MRKITKGESPEFFESFKKKILREKGRLAVYSDLNGTEEYKQLKEYLIQEQYGICCYCMKGIQFHNTHIEHFIPQSIAGDKTMDYSNLLASCNGMKEQEANCGHRKDNWYQEYLLVSPLRDGCEETFRYSVDGKISSDRMDGKETIGHLGLDSELLNRARRSAIYTSGLFDTDFEEQKENLITYYTTPCDGKLLPFCMAIVYCLKNA